MNACLSAYRSPICAVGVNIFNLLCVPGETDPASLLLEVHTLASAYGWSETETLSLRGAARELHSDCPGMSGYLQRLVQTAAQWQSHSHSRRGRGAPDTPKPQWNDVLDIGGFVWAEIESRARC